MNRKQLLGGLLALAAATVSPLAAQVPGIPGPPSLGITIGLKATTNGIGLDVAKKILPHISARVGVNGFKLDHDFNFSDILYTTSLNLKSGGLYVDLSALIFRLSAGVLYNKNQLSITADPTSAVQIGSTTYQASDIGTITGSIGFAKNVAPYLGLAMVTPGKIGIFVEGGLMFAGNTAITYTITHGPSLPPAGYAAFDAQVASEAAQLQTDINGKLKAWPVVGVGIQVKI